jgi:hypothetical protein
MHSSVASSGNSQSTIFWDRLRLLFSTDDEEPRPGKEPPRRGLAIAVSVLLSIILWLSLTLDEQRTQTLQVPVEILGTPEGMALAERPPSHVQVQMQGRGINLLRFLYNPPLVRVNATTDRVEVREEIDLPQGASVRIESVTPASFEMALDPLSTRRMPVQNRVNIDVADAYELIDPPQLEPDSVQVEGAQSIVSEMEAWPTSPRTIENLRDTVEIRVPLADTLQGLVDVRPESIALVARAGRFAQETREVTVEVTGVPAGQDLVSLQPSSIRIRYRVLFEDLFKARRSSDFFATVSYDQIRSDTTGYVMPRIGVPSDLLIRDPEPIPPRLRYYTFVSGN